MFILSFTTSLRKLRIAAVFAVLVAALLATPLTARADEAGDARYASIVIDAESGEVLFASRADSPRFPASITKVMTLYLVFEAMDKGLISSDDMILISPRAASQPPSRLGLPAGSRISVDNAIRALAVRSANDIAVALAEHVGGSESRFTSQMTRRARNLGMTQSRFVNPHGLPDSRHVSSARDLAVLSRAVMRDFPQYYGYFGQRTWGFEERSYNNTNGLLHAMPGVDGIKTGFTNASGYNLAASAVRNDRRLIAVVLGGRTTRARNNHVAELLDVGFEVERRIAAGEDPRAARALFASLPGGVGAEYALGGSGGAIDNLILANAPMLTISAALDAADRAHTSQPGSPLAQGDSADPAAGWAVQVGAFREQDVAREWLVEVERRFRSAFAGAARAVSPDDGWYRARYLGFTRTAADAACAALAERRLTCLVVGPLAG